MAYVMRKGKKVWHNAGVPKPKRTREEILEVAQKICNLFATGKYTISDCCRKYHVAPSAFWLWSTPSLDLATMLMEGKPLPRRAVPAVQDMYFQAREQFKANYVETLTQASRVGLMAKVEGVKREEVSEEYVLDTNLKDAEGKPNPNFGKMVLAKTRVKKTRDAPDTQALIFALTNVDKETFKDRKFATLDVPSGSDLTGLERLTDQELTDKKREIQMRLERLNQATEEIEYENVESE